MTVDSLDDLSPQFVGGTLLVWPPDPTANAVALGRQVVHAVDAQAAGATRAEVVLPGGKTLAGDDLGATLDRCGLAVRSRSRSFRKTQRLATSRNGSIVP